MQTKIEHVLCANHLIIINTLEKWYDNFEAKCLRNSKNFIKILIGQEVLDLSKYVKFCFHQ